MAKGIPYTSLVRKNMHRYDLALEMMKILFSNLKLI